MVTSAAVLIAAMLLLGGLLAVLGDRLGTKVGRARMRVLGLRPRHTATAIALLTGVAIAATTLALLFALSKPLRLGVFAIDDLLKDTRIAQGELSGVKTEKSKVEQDLAQSQQQLKQTTQQLKTLQAKLQTLQEERNRLIEERNNCLKISYKR